MSIHESQGKRYVCPSDVSRDNSDVFRFSVEIDRALKRERFTKSKPEAYIDYCEAAGISGVVYPFDDVDFRLDIEKFKKGLHKDEAAILDMFLLKMSQGEIAVRLGVSQPTVSNRLRRVFSKFKDFYGE